MVEVTRPPITTIANGFWVSEPTPVLIAAGIRPIAAISAVITTGRMRDTTPWCIASSRCILASRFLRNSVIRITPFCIHTPNSAINPIPAEILKFIWVTCRASIPPINANGTFIIVSKASFAFPNVTNRIIKIPSKQSGTTLLSVLPALCAFSNSPFQVIV
ncbi:hypothetical protein D3C86_1514770 [compost metagenome]